MAPTHLESCIHADKISLRCRRGGREVQCVEPLAICAQYVSSSQLYLAIERIVPLLVVLCRPKWASGVDYCYKRLRERSKTAGHKRPQHEPTFAEVGPTPGELVINVFSQ